MSPLSDSPRRSEKPNESPLQIAQDPKSDSPEPPSSDKLSALPISPSPHRSVRNERGFIPPSPSASSPQDLLGTRAFPASPEGHNVRPLTVEGSSARSSSNHRVSFDGNHHTATTPNHSTRTNVRVHPLLRETVSQPTRGMTRLGNASPSSPAARRVMAEIAGTPKKPGRESPPPPSSPHSRATSPMRLFSWPGFHHVHEDAFIPIDPFRIHTRFRRLSLHSADIEHQTPFDPTCAENPFCCFPPLRCSSEERFLSLLRDTRYFILDTLPRQMYLLLLFRLPSLYFSRIARVYEDAQLSKPDLERMIESYSSSRQQEQEQRQRIIRSSPIPPGAHYHPAAALPFPDEWTTANVSPALVRFKQSWESFIDSLLREWKTLNLVSALLHSLVSTIFLFVCIPTILIVFIGRAILSMFQTQVMANDPVIRTAALLSLTSAIMSLSFGCIYIVRFGTMRSMYKAARWAEEAARTTTFILWNVWVLLAMPAIWLAWSMIFFIVAILAFVWRYGSSSDPASPQPLSPTAAIGPRVAISALFFLGLLYLGAIVKTLHNYGRTKEHRLFARMSLGSHEMRDTAEADARGGDRGSQRGRGATRNYGRNGDRGRESPRDREGSRNAAHGEPMGAGGLSAVTGLGLTGLDELTNPRSSDEVLAEKE